MSRQIYIRIVDEDKDGQIYQSSSMANIEDLNLIAENKYHINGYMDLIMHTNQKLNESMNTNVEIKVQTK